MCLHDLNRMNPVSKHLLHKYINLKSSHLVKIPFKFKACGCWDECLWVCHFLTRQEPPESASAPSHVRHIRSDIKVELRAENLFNFPWCNILLILQACSPVIDDGCGCNHWLAIKTAVPTEEKQPILSQRRKSNQFVPVLRLKDELMWDHWHL